jgi:hypothetical protein
MRGPTAFFLFSEEQREQTRAECVAAAEPGAKMSVAVVAKAIGEKWRALSDEEKAGYVQKAAQRAKEHAEAAAAAHAEVEAGQWLHSTILHHFAYPVRRLSWLDLCKMHAGGHSKGFSHCTLSRVSTIIILASHQPLCLLTSCMPSAGGVDENDSGSSPRKEREEKTEQDANANPNPFGFPLTLIKRVMCLDPEVSASVVKEKAQNCHVCSQLIMEMGKLQAAWQPSIYSFLGAC